MTAATQIFIGACWAAWLAYWLAMAFATKRTVERGGLIGYRLVTGACILGLLGVGQLFGIHPHSQLWRPTFALGVASDCIVAAGAAFTVWARIALGRNWSAEVTFKKDHELIRTGPYALARHPIYTGLIGMGAGAAIDYGRAIGVVLFVGIVGGLWRKAMLEERIMSRHFPDAYAEYRTRVRAIIPFVL